MIDVHTDSITAVGRRHHPATGVRPGHRQAHARDLGPAVCASAFIAALPEVQRRPQRVRLGAQPSHDGVRGDPRREEVVPVLGAQQTRPPHVLVTIQPALGHRPVCAASAVSSAGVRGCRDVRGGKEIDAGSCEYDGFLDGHRSECAMRGTAMIRGAS